MTTCRNRGDQNDEDFGNIFESAGTISILKRDLRIIRRILVALIGKLSEADAEKFWKWEPGFGYQSDGRITDAQQTITFKATVASSPMEMNAPRVDYEDLSETPSGTKQRFGPRGRALSAEGNMNKPRSPMPKRTNSRPRGTRPADRARRGESLRPSSSQDGGLPRTTTSPRPLGSGLTERSRSARRQKDVTASTIPEDGTQPGHDVSDDIDFAVEEADEEMLTMM
eukprot:3324563-Amphidinium_carterae.1